MDQPLSIGHPIIRRVLHAAEALREPGFSDELRDAINGLADLPIEQRLDSPALLAAHLTEFANPLAAGALAVWFGACVEAGRDPAGSTIPILAAFLKWSATLETEPGATRPRPETLHALELLGQALVAHLARSPAQRAEIAGRQDVRGELERVAGLSVGAMWLEAILKQCSGELIVLHAEERKGARVVYENIANCFHLFTLLQAALADVMPGGRHPNPETLALARGERQGPGHDSAWWHFGQPTSPKPDIISMVFGEASPESIAKVDGRQVLLLFKPLLGNRSWDAGFFGPMLMATPPNVTLKAELNEKEVEQWWRRLGLK